MLDKVLTDENVKVNGEIVGRQPILRTLHPKYTFNQIYLTPGDITVGTPDILQHNISDFTWFYYIDARSVPSGVFCWKTHP
jgi:hypothetical protein